MDTKKEAKKYLNKYFKAQYLKETDDEYKSLVRLLNKALRIHDVRLSLPSEEDIREPIQNALYATRHFLTDECTELADGILDYLNDAGFKVVRQ